MPHFASPSSIHWWKSLNNGTANYAIASFGNAPSIFSPHRAAIPFTPSNYFSRENFSGTQNTKIQLRNPYFRKSGFYWYYCTLKIKNTSIFKIAAKNDSFGVVLLWWRRLAIRSRNRKRAAKRHIWPKGPNVQPPFEDARSHLDGKIWTFTAKDIKLSTKRLAMYARLIKGLHLQDALDWLSAIPVIRINTIYNTLMFARTQCTQLYKADIERLFIKTTVVNYGSPMKFMRAQRNGKYVIMKSWRNRLVIRIHHLGMKELFHRYYILTKIPKSLAMDMRFALHEKRVPSDKLYEWAPYLNSHSRYWHRQNLKWLNLTNQFNYYDIRNKWIMHYHMNLKRRENELRIARGLLPLPLNDSRDSLAKT